MILSYYYVLTLVTTTGIGDISSTSNLEVIFTLIVILGGKIVISVIIGESSREVVSRKFLSSKTKIKVNFKTCINYLWLISLSDN